MALLVSGAALAGLYALVAGNRDRLAEREFRRNRDEQIVRGVVEPVNRVLNNVNILIDNVGILIDNVNILINAANIFIDNALILIHLASIAFRAVILLMCLLAYYLTNEYISEPMRQRGSVTVYNNDQFCFVRVISWMCLLAAAYCAFELVRSVIRAMPRQ